MNNSKHLVAKEQSQPLYHTAQTLQLPHYCNGTETLVKSGQLDITNIHDHICVIGHT